jgi:hypothetical protein
MANEKEVKVELTEAQKAKIKAGTGNATGEPKVESVGHSTSEVSSRLNEAGMRDNSMRGAEVGEAGFRAAEVGEAGLRGADIGEQGMRTIDEQGLRGSGDEDI